MLLFLCSCNFQNKNSNSEFKHYILSLDKIDLPLKTNPFGKLPEISKEFNKQAFNKYKHSWSSQPLGIYYQNQNSIGVIDCAIGDLGLVPFLTTYDLKGNKIDSTGFYNKTGLDMGYEAIEYITFNTDMTITVIDTIKRWNLKDNETDIIDGSMRMTSDEFQYQILSNGQIEKSESLKTK